MLAAANEVEAELGRVRDVRWGPRTIDIDVLLWDGLQRDDPRLTIPHPRMHERAFVVLPLLDLEPDPVLPDGRRLLDLPAPQGEARPGRAAAGAAMTDQAVSPLRLVRRHRRRCLSDAAVRDAVRRPGRARGRRPVVGRPPETPRSPAPIVGTAPSPSCCIVAFAIGAVVFVQRHTPTTASSAPISTGRPRVPALVRPERARGPPVDLGPRREHRRRPGRCLDGLPEELVTAIGPWRVDRRHDVARRAASATASVAALPRAPGIGRCAVATGDLIAWAPGEFRGQRPARRGASAGVRRLVHQHVVRDDPPSRRSIRGRSVWRAGRASREIGTCAYLTVQRGEVPTTFLVGTVVRRPSCRVPAAQRLRRRRPPRATTRRRTRAGLSLRRSARRSGNGRVRSEVQDVALDPIRVLGWSADGTPGVRVRHGTTARKASSGCRSARRRDPRHPTRLLVTNADRRPGGTDRRRRRLPVDRRCGQRRPRRSGDARHDAAGDAGAARPDPLARDVAILLDGGLMDIAIVGAGTVGTAVGVGWARAGPSCRRG